MTDDDALLVQQLTLIARWLDQRGPAMAGPVRQAARRLLGVDQPSAGRCRHCGGELTGRQRQWCGEACRRRHRA